MGDKVPNQHLEVVILAQCYMSNGDLSINSMKQSMSLRS